MKEKKLGILGCGYLGGIVARAYHAGLLPGYRLVGVTSRTEASARALAEEAGCACCSRMEDLLALHPDIVVETAGIPALRQHAETVLEHGADLAVISIGAFADPDFHTRVRDTAARCGRKVYLASGAVGGFDVLSTITLMARAQGQDPTVTFHTRKSPQSLQGTPVYRPEMETAQQDAFAGSATQAIALLPTRVNVAVAASLAAAGPEHTAMRITSVPGFVGDDHCITVEGAGAKAVVDIYSDKSAIAGWSLVALLRNLASPLELH